MCYDENLLVVLLIILQIDLTCIGMRIIKDFLKCHLMIELGKDGSFICCLTMLKKWK